MASKKLLQQLARLQLSSEPDVEQWWVPKFLEALGYQFPRDIENAPALRFRFVGSQKVKLVKPDHVVRALGSIVFVLECKAPEQVLDQGVFEQLWTYATHPDVQAPLGVLTNGCVTKVFDMQSRVLLKEVAQQRFIEEFPALEMLLGYNNLLQPPGGLHIVEQVGEGAFGRVYKAWNPVLRRHEALKVFKIGGERERRRLVQGQRAQARLEHESIARIYGYHKFGPDIAISMYFSEGISLDRWLKERRPSLGQKLDLFDRVLSAVAYAHAHQVVHRDIKPENILVEPAGDGFRPVLVDFDTAVLAGATLLTSASEVIGTRGFMAPELLFGAALPQGRRAASADVYSLGAILYFLLFNAPPNPLLPQRLLERKVDAIQGIPVDLRRNIFYIFERSMNADLEVRYRDAGDFQQHFALMILQGGAPPTPSEEEFISDTLARIDELLEAGIKKQIPSIAFERHHQEGRYVAIPDFGDMALLYDADYRAFMVGFSFEVEQWEKFSSGPMPKQLRRRFGRRLQIDAPNALEDGGAVLMINLSEALLEGSDQTASRLVGYLEQFLSFVEKRLLAD